MRRPNPKGTVLIMAMIILAILSAWSASIFSSSNTNAQLANNHHKLNSALAAAQSGQQVTRYWLSRFAVPGTTNNDLFDLLCSSIQSDLQDNGITDMNITLDGSSITLSASLASEGDKSFTAEITRPDSLNPDTVRVEVTGRYSTAIRTIAVNYTFGSRAHNVFNYGVASKGPLSLSGNIELDGVNVSVESDVFIESAFTNESLSIIGNSEIAGDVHIANPLAMVNLQGGQASIGGENGEAAFDHVHIGIDPPEFPVPVTDIFQQYATNTIDGSTDTSVERTYENVRILAGTNPCFTGDAVLKGLVFIETPNIITFTGNVDITGLIVGAGSADDNSGANQINFNGNIDSNPVTALAGQEKFDALQIHTGTFILAPGFELSFGGNFSTLNGAIAGNGIDFYGNAGGVIEGTIVNYSDEQMTLTGNSDQLFNRSGKSRTPAGFSQDIVLRYQPNSYLEQEI